MKLLFTIILSSFLFSSVSAQNIHIYEIKLDGTKGKLIRMEDYRNSNSTEVSHYDEDKQLSFVLSMRYNDKKQLVKEVKTFKNKHEYDLITEYYYDSYGREYRKSNWEDHLGISIRKINSGNNNRREVWKRCSAD